MSVFMILAACGGGGGNEAPGESISYQLSGEINTLSGIAFDTDVNDPEASYLSNDDFDVAQYLPSPFSLGGYVNMPGQGNTGRSFESGDQHDIYRLRLIRDQVVTLSMAGSASGNIGLKLFTSDNTAAPVVAFTGNQTSKSVVSPANGEYFLQVEALSGATTYTLTTGLTQVSGRELRSMDFYPGEVLVKFRPDSRLDTRMSLISGLNLRLLTGHGNSTRQYVIEGLANTKAGGTAASMHTLEVVKQLQASQAVLYAEPNYRVRPYRTPGDALFHLQWHYPIVNLPAAWDLETGSSDVVVAVIDTGILRDHPDLEANLIPGYDFITSLERAGDGDGADPDPTDPGVADSPEKSSAFHGTHVAGIIAANSDNNEGVAATAWGIKLMPLRAIGTQDGSVADVADAILYAAGLANGSGQLPLRPADIINLSLGTTDYSQVLADAVTAARAAGVIIVAAAGNDSSASRHYPAALPEVLSVNAIESTGLRAGYSNVGDTIDLAAPGGDNADHNGDGLQDAILSTLGDATGKRSYEFLKGTSMASAHVAGIVSLMESVFQRHNQDLTPEMLEQYLLSGRITRDSGDTGWDEIYGYGLIDAYKAVSASIEEVTGTMPPAPAPRLAVSPANLNLGTSANEGHINLTNLGSMPPGFSIVSVSSDQEWLTITRVDEPVSEETVAGLGGYQIIADRQHPSLQNDDLYLARVTFTSNEPGSTADISFIVYLQVSTFVAEANAGSQHVNLIDTSSGQTIQTSVINPVNGSYPYQFKNIPAGRYQITTYTDTDNDNSACETGESCGAYPTLGGAYIIDVDMDLTGLDFAASLSLDLLW